jgi:hypothetical protein
MKLVRLLLRNFRGVRERELRFAPLGVTVVHGPNEIGKTSLAEAIDLVLEELDSAAKQRVRAVQPVDRDAGSEVEIELETGPYRFVLAKRFHRDPATRLSVAQPQAESWTGREAHQRVQAILDATVDRELWRALRVAQGQGFEQAAWLGRPALAAALDRASTPGAGVVQETLLEAARAERARYYTPTGRERRDFEARAREVTRLRDGVRELEEALRSLERDVARDAELRAARPGLEAAAEQSERALREAEDAAARTQDLREALVTARARRDGSAAEERQALQESRARGQLLTLRAASEADAAQRAEELESAEPELLACRAEADHAAGAHAAARETCDAAAASVRRARAALELARAQAEHTELERRAQRCAAVAEERDAAQHALSELQVDAALADAIRVAEREVTRARDRLQAEEPVVHLTAHADLELDVDGRSVRVAAGERFERRVSDSLVLSLPGVADLGVVAGAGAAALRKQLDEVRTRWGTLCAEAGVADHADALRALEQRLAGEAALAAAEQTLRELLAGETPQRLAARTESLAQQIAALQAVASLPDGELFPPRLDADASAAALAEAERQYARAQESERAAGLRKERAAARAAQLEQRARDTETRLALARKSLTDQEARLEAARGECPDEELARRLDDRSARARSLDAEAQEAARRLEAADPEQAERALDAAQRALSQRRSALQACREEQIGIATRLEVRGEQGLFEQLEETRGRWQRAEREMRAERRRAQAAALLCATLEREREASHKSYAGPLRARIEALGAEVFGADFHVELDDELRVATRAHNGVALPFEQLSAGAREQIALLARLACATLVADDGGAPVLLDDALGHSDAQRLAGLGRALAAAGRRCQVIVLTCDPERYRHVDGAQFIELA